MKVGRAPQIVHHPLAHAGRQGLLRIRTESTQDGDAHEPGGREGGRCGDTRQEDRHLSLTDRVKQAEKAQEETVAKAEKKLQDLKDDQVSLEKKLQQNKIDQDSTQKDIENQKQALGVLVGKRKTN